MALRVSTSQLRATQQLLRWGRIARRICHHRKLHSSSSADKKTTSSYWNEGCTTPLSSLTVGGHIDCAAQKWSDSVGWAFVQEDKECTFAQFQEQVDKLARGLLSIGFGKGDTLAIWSPNTFNWVLIAGAMAKVGIVSASIHFALTASEVERCLNTVDFKGIYIAEPFKVFDYYEVLCSLVPELRNSKPGELDSKKYPSLKTVIADGDRKLPGCFSLRELAEGGKADLQAAQEQVGMDDPFTIVFTSGTTGNPKAAVLSHHSFVNNVIALDHRVQFSQENICCNPLPFFHVYGLSVVLGRTLVPGMKSVVPSPSFDLAATLKAIQQHRCTDISGSPTMYLDIINSPLRKHYDISSLQRAETGGNIVTPAVRKLIREKLNVPVRVGFGASELTAAMTIVSEHDPDDKQIHTVGRPLAYLEMKIADPVTGREQPVHTPGEVWCRGHNVFLGYYNDEQKTRECMTNAGWYKTGDVGVMDEDGYVTIVSRIKDVVIRGGENIFPGEVEDVLNTYPAVHESLVIGVPDERMGEEVCAWVVLKEGANVTDDELKEYCKDKLTRFKIPRYFIYNPNVPRTPIGKAQKAKMRPLATEMLGLAK
ncbi:medium-chain acyl-CoA ligase ACSF2, mitochondrial-like isoform X1 [Haemaphysalis longicornis]